MVVTAASVPECQASKQVFSFGLRDGTKGSTAVFARLSIEVTAAIGFSNEMYYSGGFTTATNPRLGFTEKKIGA